MIARVMGLETRAASPARDAALVARMEREVQSMWQRTAGLSGLWSIAKSGASR